MIGRSGTASGGVTAGLRASGSGFLYAFHEEASAWQKVSVALLCILALGVVHGLLYNLHAILVPFVLSGFIVLSLQPAVDLFYRLFAGLSGPQRWCICCARRVDKGARRRDIESRMSPREDSPLVDVALATEDYGVKAMESISRFCAVALVLSLMVLTIIGIGLILVRGALHMKDDWGAYKAGFMRLSKRLNRWLHAFTLEFHISKEMDNRIAEVYEKALASIQDYMLELVNGILQGLSGGLADGAIMMLYILFWLMEPLSAAGGKTAGELVRSYLYMKTIVSFLYGVCVALLFLALGVDLAVLFGMIGFFLNFVPEVGVIMSMVIPAPIILLDGRIKYPFNILLASIAGQLFLKFIFGNILEVKLIEKDREMSIHPVWVIFGLCYFGFIWGPAGMLLSVPIMAMLKTAAASAQQLVSDEEAHDVVVCADKFLTCVEGRKKSSRMPSTPPRDRTPPRRASPSHAEDLLTGPLSPQGAAAHPRSPE